MKHVTILLSESTFEKIGKLARLKGVEAGQYCSAFLEESVDHESLQSQEFEKPGIRRAERIKEIEMMKEIVIFLKSKGGSAQKTLVESAVFEKFKFVFQNEYYMEPVGGGVPRWKKNVQFASNTAKNWGYMKPHTESGRGIWELTEKGKLWNLQ